jgi:hypothetical protein
MQILRPISLDKITVLWVPNYLYISYVPFSVSKISTIVLHIFSLFTISEFPVRFLFWVHAGAGGRGLSGKGRTRPSHWPPGPTRDCPVWPMGNKELLIESQYTIRYLMFINSLKLWLLSRHKIFCGMKYPAVLRIRLLNLLGSLFDSDGDLKQLFRSKSTALVPESDPIFVDI